MRTITRQLPAPPHFCLVSTALSHGWHECAPMSWSHGGQCLQIIERLGTRACRVSITQPTGAQAQPEGAAATGDVAEPAPIVVSMEAEDLTDEEADEVLGRMRFALALDVDLTEFYELCRDHPVLRAAPGIGAGRWVRSPTMFEAIIKTICGTNVTWLQGVKMINRIAQLGPHVPHFRHLNAWPSAREVLRAGEPYLDDVCRLGYRTESILALCLDVRDGRTEIEELPALVADASVPTEDLFRKMLLVRGIGPTSAHYLLTMLGRFDRLVIDTATVAHVARFHLNGRKPTKQRIERIYARYGRWKNLVYWVEHWLTWGTAAGILRGAGLEPIGVPKRRSRGAGDG
jgi:3-methyladenine DNA glycosylase/8-oxoguanine DNA glycosylase